MTLELVYQSTGWSRIKREKSLFSGHLVSNIIQLSFFLYLNGGSLIVPWINQTLPI